MAIQRLTVAYRSRSRPSSTLGAKASTVCPYYLDGDQARPIASRREPIAPGPVIPVFSRRLSMAADVASVQFSRTAERLLRRPAARSGVETTPPRRPADAGLSKLNSMLAVFAPAVHACPK